MRARRKREPLADYIGQPVTRVPPMVELAQLSKRVVEYGEASASDEWGTDPETFAALNERYEFGFDLAASPPQRQVPAVLDAGR